MRYKRYKLVISAPALLSMAVFVFGLIVILLYSLEVYNGSRFLINITFQTFCIYLFSSVIGSFLIFKFLKRRAE
jgi:hypothetical protein